jgi:hypothetical protein
MNAQQNAGIDDINATAGSYIPYMDKATAATTAGMGPAYEGIDRYMSPYIKDVADTTGAYMRQQQEQAQSGALGTAAMSGAFGGDRAGIAAANLQQQNQMGYGKTMADIMNQGYTQALGASQADLARQLQGGAQMAGLGAQSQQLGLQGAQAKIAAGTMQQQTEQAGKDAMINRFMQEQGYPFQVAQFLANIAMGTGAAQGSTTTTQTPRSIFGFAQGGGVAGPRTYSQGSIGVEGYVPVGDLPVGQLMMATPPEQQKDDTTSKILQLISSSMGAAHGGVINGRHGYATDGGVNNYSTEALRREMAIRNFDPKYLEEQRKQQQANVNAAMNATSSNPTNMGRSYPTTGVAPAPRTTSQMNADVDQVLNEYKAEQSNMGHLDTIGRYALPTMTGVAPTPRTAVEINDAATPEYRAVMEKAFGAMHPDTDARYTMPTGLVRPPVNAIKELNLGSGDPFNAFTASSQPPAIAEKPPAGLALPVPTPKEYAIGNDIYLKHPNGFITYANGERISPDMAESIRNEIDRQDRLSGEARVMQGDEMLGMFRKSQEDLAQRNKDALRGMYEGNFPVPTYDMPKATPANGVAAPVMTVRPGAVQQPMPFMASEKPRYTLPTDLGTPPTNDLASTVSPRPQPRPSDLGTPAVPAVDKNGIAGPEQTGIYTGVAGTGAGFVDLVRQDGSVEHRTGARNWRNNNPGNIEYGKLAQQYGAIGTDGRFAIFPDEQSGRNAMKGLLFDSGIYQGMTIASALNKYSPPSENDTEGKIRAVVAEIGLDPNTPLDQMTPQQRDAFTLAIQHTEGPMKGDVGASNPYTTSQVGGLGSADMAQQRDGLFNNNKSYGQRNMIGKFFHNPDGSLNQNAIMSLLSGIGSMAQAQTISPIGAILAGVAGGSDTYKGLLKQQADIAQTQALTGQTQIEAAAARFRVGPDGMPMVIMPDGSNVDYYTFKASPELQAQLGSAQTAAIVKAAETAGVAAAASAPDAAIYNTPEVQDAYKTELSTLRSLHGDRSTSDAVVSNINNAAAAAGGNMRANTFMQLNAFAGLNGNPAALGGGYQAALRANMAKALNLVGGMVGLGNDGGFAAETDIIKKAASILGTDAARNLDQGTLGALQEIMNGLPNAEQDPKASAKLMASIIQGQQRAIDLKKWNDGYIKRENGNPTMTAFGSEAKFNDNTAQIYEQEKPYLEALVLKGGDPSTADPTSGMTPVQMLTSGQLTPQETATVLSQLFPQGYPSHLVTTFSR